MELIEKTKVQKHVEDRKRKRDDDQDGGAADVHNGKEKLVRKFRQTQALGDQYGERDSQVDPRFLKSVFARTKGDA